MVFGFLLWLFSGLLCPLLCVLAEHNMDSKGIHLFQSNGVDEWSARLHKSLELKLLTESMKEPPSLGRRPRLVSPKTLNNPAKKGPRTPTLMFHDFCHHTLGIGLQKPRKQ